MLLASWFRLLHGNELGNGAAAFNDTEVMVAIAAGIADAAGCSATKLLRNTRNLAESCIIDGRRDLGLGEVYVPEREIVVASTVERMTAQAQLQWQCENKYRNAIRSGLSSG